MVCNIAATSKAHQDTLSSGNAPAAAAASSSGMEPAENYIPAPLLLRDLSGDSDDRLNFEGDGTEKKPSGKIPFRFRYLKPFGVRNLYQWGKICFPKGSKHAGLPFSQVLTQDPQYCRWIEGRPARVSSGWMKNFQNYMQAVENAKMQATSVQQDAAEGARSLILDKIPLDGRRVGQKP